MKGFDLFLVTLWEDLKNFLTIKTYNIILSLKSLKILNVLFWLHFMSNPWTTKNIENFERHFTSATMILVWSICYLDLLGGWRKKMVSNYWYLTDIIAIFNTDCWMYHLGIEVKVNDWVSTNWSLGHHGWYGENIIGEVSVGLVPGNLCYRGAGIGKPTEHEWTQLNISIQPLISMLCWGFC